MRRDVRIFWAWSWPIRAGTAATDIAKRRSVYLYGDVLVRHHRSATSTTPALAPRSADRPKARRHAVHIGAGVGYYGVAHLVGRSGQVTRSNSEGAGRAARPRNFPRRQCPGRQGDGAAPISTGRFWLCQCRRDPAARPGSIGYAMRKAGLAADLEQGFADFGAESIERRGAAFRSSAAALEFLRHGSSRSSRASARDVASRLRLMPRSGRVCEVERLYRRDDVPDADCWVRGPGWCLAYR